MSSQYSLIINILLYCAQYNTMVPRWLIRNKSLPINLIEMAEKNKLIFLFGSRICIVEESRRIITNQCRNKSEYSTKPTYADTYRTQGREHTKSEEKLDGRVIRTTVVWRTVREIPFGIDKTDGSHAQLTR